ncbi:MAG: phenylalanine--tRNA ligase subunit beta [Spirochaetales bacterium]|nr:phenylalanine--tRNA ligase subunit beta [Spirochaetales bacterium]
MKVSIDWIKDFVELPDAPPHTLGEEFTLTTCEVEDVTVSGEVLSQVFVAEITGFEPHPQADKLNLVQFDAGPRGRGRVVCGAPNVQVGLKVPYAPVGTTLPVGFTLEPKEIRGIVSEGMLCAEDELGISDDHEGLMVLKPDAQKGITLAEYLGTGTSVVLDIDNKSITHRPDLWGHYGMAREFGAAFGKPLSRRFTPEWAGGLLARFPGGDSPVRVKVEADSCCLGYFGYTVKGIRVEQSPKWMQRRLHDCGMRPINSIVDISNYVMLELGIPNHLFDKNKIEGGLIHVRRAGEAGEFVTLDEMPRQLVESDTVVADAKKPLVIAGIMGGANSGVSEDTTEVFVEVANWKDVEIRKTSTRIGLRTDSSLRYEKTLDTLSLKTTALRILELLMELNPGASVVGSLEYDGMDLSSIEPLVIDLDHRRIESILGTAVPEDRVIGILQDLDFEIDKQTQESESRYRVTVPSFRATKDVQCDADLIEEIGRIYGYGKLTPTPPLWTVEATALSPAKKMHRKIQDFFVLNAGAHEVMTYPLTGEGVLKKASWPDLAEKLTLANALSPEYSRMRPSIIPGFLEAAALNARHYDAFTMFEYGRVYRADDKDFSVERNHLVAGFYAKTATRFIEAVNGAENLFKFLSIPGSVEAVSDRMENYCLPRDWKGNHPIERRELKVMGRPMGTVVTVHPLLLSAYKMKGYLTLLVLDLHDIESREMKDKTAYTPLSRFPASVFDFSVVADSRTEARLVLDAARSYRCKEIDDIKIACVFPLDGDKKSVTLRVRFLDRDKTLSGAFLEEAQKGLIDAVEKAGFPLKR